MEELITKRIALRFEGDHAQQDAVSLIQEIPLTIYLNGEEFVTLLCTGHHMGDLSIGFLRAEGLVDGPGDVARFQVDEKAGVARVELVDESRWRQALYLKRTLGSGCGRASVYHQPLDGLRMGPVPEGPQVTTQQIRERMREMNQRSPLYRATRGTHNAALAQADRILLNREDIGRHNAVDMIVGHALREGLSLGDKMLLTTGRASSEIVLKAARVGIPILVSRSAATHLAVQVADSVGMTLIGYVRGERMTVYSHPERLVRDQESGVRDQGSGIRDQGSGVRKQETE